MLYLHLRRKYRFTPRMNDVTFNLVVFQAAVEAAAAAVVSLRAAACPPPPAGLGCAPVAPEEQECPAGP